MCAVYFKEKCHIKEVPFRGVNCSDAAGTQKAYAVIYKMAEISMTKWNTSSLTPYFDCVSIQAVRVLPLKLNLSISYLQMLHTIF